MSREFLKKKIEEVEKEKRELESELLLFDLYDDLRIHMASNNRRIYSSKSVNHLCNKVNVVAACNCCYDPATVATPYYQSDTYVIHSDPREFELKGGWQHDMRECNIPETIIQEVEKVEEEIRISREQEDLEL